MSGSRTRRNSVTKARLILLMTNLAIVASLVAKVKKGTWSDGI